MSECRLGNGAAALDYFIKSKDKYIIKRKLQKQAKFPVLVTQRKCMS